MDPRAAKAGQVLNHLATSLNQMMDLLQTTVDMIRPPSASTLPGVAATLSGIAQAAEHAAIQVLDEADALHEDQRQLTVALDELAKRLPPGDADATAAWDQAAACAKSLSARALKFTAAMEFQDLAAQHIGKIVTSVEDVRARLRAVLTLFQAPGDQAPDYVPLPESEIGSPTRTRGEGQALADKLLADRG